MTHKFAAGFAAGVATAIAGFAAAAFTYKTRVMNPQEEEEQWIHDNRIKANRKSHGAHIA